jgi:hypothetical protein
MLYLPAYERLLVTFGDREPIGARAAVGKYWTAVIPLMRLSRGFAV